MFDYSDSVYPVREDIQSAHRAFWQALAQPGTWLTGEQRVAVAAETRAALDCDYCSARRQALSPYTFKGQHAAVTGLPDIWVDAVHRIVTDQTRITGDYIAANAGSGLSKAEYAELVGVVVAVISVDEFNRAIGVAAETLPEPVTGEPTRYTPECLVEDTGYLPMIARDRTGEREQDLWRPGRTANVLRALSSVPNAVRDWLALAEAQYLSIARMAHFGEFDDRSINRMQMELVAGRVSAWNQCFY